MKRKSVWPVMLLLVLITACGGRKSGVAEKGARPALEMYVFDVGQIRVNDISQLNGGEEVEAPVIFTNTAFLIRHPKGDLIWDTGFADSVVHHPLGAPEDPYYSTMAKTLASQLKEIGVNPLGVEYLAVSHKHPDHSGNMNLFSESTVILQQVEYEALFESEEPGVDLESLRDNEFIRLEGEHDVFGDGSVRIIPTPGHTGGHQVLYVDMPQTGPVVLSGDLWLFNPGVKSQAVPLFNEDRSQTSDSWQKITKLLNDNNATLWVQHDRQQMERIPRSPEVIR